MSDEDIMAFLTAPPPEVDLSLSRFVEDPCIRHGATLIPRREVIKYVANKLGGAHYDPRRDDKGHPLHSTLDAIRREFFTAGRDPVYFELLSVAQALRDSPDIRAFVDLNSKAPEQ